MKKKLVLMEMKYSSLKNSKMNAEKTFETKYSTMCEEKKEYKAKVFDESLIISIDCKIL